MARFIRCMLCAAEAIGFATDFRIKKWYCLKHFNEMQSRLNTWMDKQEQRQWGDQEWYQGIFGQIELL